MKKKSADKFHGVKFHGFGLIVVLPVFIGENYFSV